MHAQTAALKPLSSVTLTSEDNAILAWIRSAKWELVEDAKDSKPFRAKVPEFFKGARLYSMHATGGNAGMGGLDLFVKKLGIQGVLTKQNMYPVSGHGTGPRFLTLTNADLDNLGVDDEEGDED
jgi:hypothetical protein